MTRRYFSSTAERTTLTNTLSDAAGTMIVAGTPGFPGTRPYTLIIDPDTINEEIVEVTAVSGTTLTVTRGIDGTTAVAHDIGAVVMHGFTGRDLGDPQAHMDTSEGVHGVTGDVVGTEGVQTLTGKNLDGVDNVFTNIPQASVTDLVGDLAEKAPIASPTFTGTVVLPGTTSVGDVSATELGYVNGVTSSVQAQLDALSGDVDDRAPIASPTFTGDVVLPASTTIGSVTALEIGRLTGLLSNVQDQIDAIVAGASGLPVGGTEGQILAKASDTDYDVEWIDAPAGGVGTGTSVIAVAPYPTGGTVTTYTDGGTGYEYRVHTFLYSGLDDALEVTTGVIGNLLVVGAGGACGGGVASKAGGGGAGALYEQVYAFGAGSHRVYVGAGDDGSAIAETTKFDDVWCYGGGRGADGQGFGTVLVSADGGCSGGSGDDSFGGGGPVGSATYGSTDGGVSTDSTLVLGASGTSASGGGTGGDLSHVSEITGSSVTYAIGGLPDDSGTDGTANTGSGGRSGGGVGADGVAIVRYRTA